MWEVQLKGRMTIAATYEEEIDEDGEEVGYELSVVKTTNKLGKASWGWGGTDKIILFGSGIGENEVDCASSKDIRFAQRVAEMLCAYLNSVGRA